MKHLFLFAIITAIFSVACKKDEKENPSMKNTDVVTDSTLIHWSENPMLFSKQRDIEQVVHLTSDYDSLFFYVQNRYFHRSRYMDAVKKRAQSFHFSLNIHYFLYKNHRFLKEKSMFSHISIHR